MAKQQVARKSSRSVAVKPKGPKPKSSAKSATSAAKVGGQSAAKSPVRLAAKSKMQNKSNALDKSKGRAKSSSKPSAQKNATVAAASPSLGRPKVTGEELLFLLFKEDYHARQIFDFLRVERVRDLEQFSPQEIVKLLSRPITDTVQRIRRKLAEKNRSLKDDAAFVQEFQEST